MARYVAEGAGVTLVTCTAGEMGEILVPDLEHLAADRDDQLGEHRRGEIADAMKALGVTDHRWLGGADRKSTRLNSSHLGISYAVFCLKKKKKKQQKPRQQH